MIPDSLSYIRARDTAGHLLESVGLQTYLYEVEPCGEDWMLRVECAAPDGWHTRAFRVGDNELTGSADDQDVSRKLTERLRAGLSGCARR